MDYDLDVQVLERYILYTASCGTVPSCTLVALKADCIETSFSALIELVSQHVPFSLQTMIPASKAFSDLSIYPWIFLLFGWNLALTKETIHMTFVLYYQA